MDVDIQFGELEESTPEVRMRPDQNKHYAVVPCQCPDKDELPIYVDVDVMRDIESHALSNTRVELGGVLLGGQYTDEQGKPFVVITDSLRAEHYEATKGSFKFTHDTWEAITRQRDDFPDDLQMVGWYHTHPDWGVFLSGMDMFICDNFFNRVLDVALVVDPCRDDRGWFQWTGDSQQRVKRTGGFYLIGSRFREADIQFFADLLRGENSMAADPRRSAIAGHVGMQPAPIVNISDSRGALQSYAIMGMLTMQFCLLVLVAWFLFANPSASTGAANQSIQAAVGEQKELRSQVQAEVLADIIKGTDPSVAKNLVEKYEQAKAEVAAAKSDLNAQRAVSENSIYENELLVKNLDGLKQDLKEAESELAQVKEKAKEAAKEYSDALAEMETAGQPIWKNWKVWVGGAVLCILSAVIGFATAIGLKKSEDDFDTDDRGDRFRPRDQHDQDGGIKSEAAESSKTGIEFEADNK